MMARINDTLVPRPARRHLIRIGLGWTLAGCAEALAYTMLALAIIHRWSPLPVLISAGLALCLTVLCSRAGYITGAHLAGDLYGAMGEALARAKLAWFTASNRSLITRAAGIGIPTFMGVPAHQLQTFILAPLTPALLLISIAVIGGPQPALLAAVLLLVSLLAQYRAQRSLARADNARQEHSEDAARGTLELVEHLELLRTAAGPRRALRRAEGAWQAQERALARTNRAAAPATLISAVASILPLAGMLILLGATPGAVDPGRVLALIILTGRASAPLNDLALAGIAIADLQSATASYREILAAPTLPSPTDAERRSPKDSSFALVDVTAPPALSELTATLPAGGRIHVAGPTGAGKSTLLGLLMRFDDPASGQVVLGGVPLGALTEHDLAERIAYVPQDPVVFTGTLASNIRIGRPDASDEEMIAAARAAALGPLIERDPLGLDQSVGRYGAALSGGERQRVAIARALIKGADILILDEATSALDDETESQIADNIRGLDATIIFITHRSPDIWDPDCTITLGSPAGDEQGTRPRS